MNVTAATLQIGVYLPPGGGVVQGRIQGGGSLGSADPPIRISVDPLNRKFGPNSKKCSPAALLSVDWIRPWGGVGVVVGWGAS